jgi:hypothetical protein
VHYYIDNFVCSDSSHMPHLFGAYQFLSLEVLCHAVSPIGFSV